MKATVPWSCNAIPGAPTHYLELQRTPNALPVHKNAVGVGVCGDKGEMQ